LKPVGLLQKIPQIWKRTSPTAVVNEALKLREEGGRHTEASIALFNRSNILMPWEMAFDEATKRLPAEHIDKRRTAF
jgi:hypothetical protein